MTLKELIEKHGYGKKFVFGVYQFTPLGMNSKGSYVGFDEYDDAISWHTVGDSWELYEEPKKKIKKWEWLVEPRHTKHFISHYLRTEEEMKCAWPLSKLTKLREFEVDEG